MKLFIAEKPSVAKAIAAELGVSGRGDGFINCRNDVVVTWCFGHLLEQAEPDAYLPDDIPKTKKGRKIWRMQDLPIFPQHWLMEAKSERGAKKQLSVIGKWLKSAATGGNAGDPDREGQLLVDEVLEHFRARQPVERFWVSAVDPASIRKGLAKLGDNCSYAGMRDAARGRSRADWLLGEKGIGLGFVHACLRFSAQRQKNGTRRACACKPRKPTHTTLAYRFVSECCASVYRAFKPDLKFYGRYYTSPRPKKQAPAASHGGSACHFSSAASFSRRMRSASRRTKYAGMRMNTALTAAARNSSYG